MWVRRPNPSPTLWNDIRRARARGLNWLQHEASRLPATANTPAISWVSCTWQAPALKGQYNLILLPVADAHKRTSRPVLSCFRNHFFQLDSYEAERILARGECSLLNVN